MENNTTAIVTGAAKGIGAGIARALGAAGYAVVVNYRSDAEAAAVVVKQITGNGGRAVAVQADVSDKEQVTTLFAAARDAFGTVGVLVNNAAIATFGPLEAITAEDFHHQLGINLLGPILTTQAFTAQADGPASIINVSTAGTSTLPAYAGLYVATKSALNAFTVIAAKELASRNIRVNAMAPGVSDTDGTRSSGFIGSELEAQALTEIPLGRLGVPDDYGPVAVFLASAASRWITGDVLLVSGGQR
ncbi:SDR family NAD(P)-dependent oxidoreductase [Actinoplanes sp. NPDC051494]|uniref:SDR family NAD(P)-dependent oxidoreductase n=1 Tax=Actinoplanes sp. NPDC051494 TaxID=3363907 RepID=UPI0037AC3B88